MRPRTPRGVLTLVLVLTLPLVTPKIRGADEIQYFSYLPSIAFDHDLAFANEYEHFYNANPQGLAGFKETFLDRREAETGRPINYGPIGSALLWSPFYALAHLFVLGARALGSGVAANGLSAPYVAAVCYASWLYGVLGLLLIHDGLVRFGHFPDRTAALAVAALALGSPVLYYLTLAPGFSHAPSLAVVAALVWLTTWARKAGDRARLRAWGAVGLAGGLAALVREQDGLFLLVPGLVLLVDGLPQRQVGTAFVRGAVMGATAFLAFVPQLLAYKAMNGRFGPSRLVTRKMSYGSPHALEVLFDPGHGLFVWSPLLLLAAIGLVVLYVKRKDVFSVALLGALLFQVWINGAVESWSQAGAFGSRRFVAATVLFAWGLAALHTTAAARVGTALCSLLLAVCVWWNLSLMVQFGLKLMDRQRLDWPRVAVNQIVEVPPRMGRVAWLFLTDRERLVREGP